MVRGKIISTKNICKYIVVFLISASIMAGLLVLSACIPRTAIESNMKSSAEYLAEAEIFGLAVEGAEGSRIDHYADAILLGIAWQYDAQEPLRSVMLSSWYHDDHNNENDNLLAAVTEHLPANQQYLRYWHGSIAVVRPLLTFLDLEQIYALNGVAIGALALILLAVMIKRKMYALAFGVLGGLIASAFWFVHLSLEYSWVFLLMLVFSIIIVAGYGRIKSFGLLFMFFGMATSFMDFLTAETLTLLVPLLILIWLQREGGPPFNTALRMILAWGIGYAGMWIFKWLLAALVLQENVLPFITEHISERMIGDVGAGTLSFLPLAIWRNIRCLFPLGWGTGGAVAGGAMILAVIYCGYVYRSGLGDKKLMRCLLALGLLPYLRYALLLNHSYLHCFFTYRAQMASVLAMVLILSELTRGADDGRGKKKRG